MKILALDQDSYKIGYAIFVGDKLVESDVVKFKGNLIERLCAIERWTKKIIKAKKIEMVLFEDIFARNMNTYKILSMLRGILEVTLYKTNVEYLNIAASTWKNGIHLAGKGRDDQKLDGIRFALENYPIKKSITNDEADAICLGHYWIHKEQFNNAIEGWANLQ